MSDEKQSKVFTSITLSTNEKVPLIMPKVGDILPTITDGNTPWFQFTMAVITGRPWEWFQNLSIPDGTKVIQAAQPALRAVTEMMTQLSTINTSTKH